MPGKKTRTGGFCLPGQKQDRPSREGQVLLSHIALLKSLAQDGFLSLEDYLLQEGIPRTACTETPGLADIGLRIKANVHIISMFLDYISL